MRLASSSADVFDPRGRVPLLNAHVQWPDGLIYGCLGAAGLLPYLLSNGGDYLLNVLADGGGVPARRLADAE
jgi:hypothetical protein